MYVLWLMFFSPQTHFSYSRQEQIIDGYRGKEIGVLTAVFYLTRKLQAFTVLGEFGMIICLYILFNQNWCARASRVHHRCVLFTMTVMYLIFYDHSKSSLRCRQWFPSFVPELVSRPIFFRLQLETYEQLANLKVSDQWLINEHIQLLIFCFQPLSITVNAFAAAGDVLIASILCTLLYCSRTGFRRCADSTLVPILISYDSLEQTRWSRSLCVDLSQWPPDDKLQPFLFARFCSPLILASLQG